MLDALSGREELTELDLGDNLIGGAGAEVIGKFIGDRDNLMKLRVSNNLLGDAAAGMVCLQAAEHCGVTVLGVGSWCRVLSTARVSESYC